MKTICVKCKLEFDFEKKVYGVSRSVCNGCKELYTIERNNRESSNEYKLKWYHNHKEEELERRADRREKEIKEFGETRFKKSTRKRRLKLIEVLGGKCVHCSFTDWRALQVDHPYGYGLQDRKRFKNSYQFFNYVLKFPEEYQLLCANCNWIKRYENKEYRN